mmetsp:Transcript_17863/g.24609  ORF Transcript_17863/g.24609 Transcript_17863/m.24609 type:complete len:90 (-) Transcript_17863:432-701(-)
MPNHECDPTEVFPTEYEPMMFQYLLNDVGAHGYPILNATPADFKRKNYSESVKNPRMANNLVNQNVPLVPNVDDIIWHINEVTQRRQQG